MSKLEIKQKHRIRELVAGLKPFAKFTYEPDHSPRFKSDEIFIPTHGDVWLYVGHEYSGIRPHLHTEDFDEARRLVG